jgi:hypothetical protein
MCENPKTKERKNLHMGYCPFLVKLLRGEKIFAWLNGAAARTIPSELDTIDDMAMTCLPHGNLSTWKTLLDPMFAVWVLVLGCGNLGARTLHIIIGHEI